MKPTSCIYNGPVNRCLPGFGRIGGCARTDHQEPHLGRKSCESPLHGKRRMNLLLNSSNRIRTDMLSLLPSLWMFMPSLNLPRSNAGEVEARARAKEKAVQTRSKEEDSHGWISILEKARREREITKEVTRHRRRLNLVSTFETPVLARMATTAGGVMTRTSSRLLEEKNTR